MTTRGRADVLHMGAGCVEVFKDGACRGGDARPLHDIFGKGLAALKPGTVAVRPEAGDARFLHGIGDAEGQRQFRAGNHKADFLRGGQR